MVMAAKRQRVGERKEYANGAATIDAERPLPEFREPGEGAFSGGGEDDEVDFSLLEAVERENHAAVEVLDVRGVKKLVLSFEKKLRDNLEARMKHMDQPEKFLESEVELDEEVRKMHVLAGAPVLYTQLVNLNAVSSIAGLLSHENTDISVDVVNLLHELTDEDVILGTEEDENNAEAEAGLLALVEALVNCNALELLVQNLSRLNENDTDESAAAYKTLGIIESMVEVKPMIAELVCERTKLLRWLLTRVTKREYDGTKLYSSEILSILLQSSTANQKRLGQMDGVDALLQAVAMYKGRDPRSVEEAELVENLFAVLCSVVMPAENKERFVKAEGVELMLIILKQRRFAYASGIKVLDFALTRCPAACERFVEGLGLRALFAAFMGRVVVKQKLKGAEHSKEQIEERVISIIASLFGGLSRGPRRDRLLSKFTESEFEKTDRLMELYVRYSDKVMDEDRRQAAEAARDLEMSADERYLAKLDAGLFTLQLLALIFAHIWTAALPGSQERIDLLLHQHKLSRVDLKDALQVYHDNVGDADGSDEMDKRRSKIVKLMAQLAG
eukprot:TRINITY_DN15853_c0_g1_i1.p1 TRINITY_DN15853_c0_g1~~TRINITY_DN15853_c0_g1_i1.p1  ORF type:complete len:561 (+),score=122.73 TRINITY_DN15853_c0_g1_i1:530-2212(+)